MKWLVINKLGILCSISLFILSCSNNHCDQPMVATLVASFYSDSDTTQQRSPKFLLIKGVGSDSIINASNKNNVSLQLKKFDGLSRFSFLIADEWSIVDTFVFVEKRNIADCPCGNPASDSVSVYEKNGELFFLCDRSSNLLLFYKDELFLQQKTSPDTLFASKPTEDILSIKHTNTHDFVSAECGCLTTYYINEVQFTRNYIREVSITDSSVTNRYNAKHIKIYFKDF